MTAFWFKAPALKRTNTISSLGLRPTGASYAWHLTQDVCPYFDKTLTYYSGDCVTVMWSDANSDTYQEYTTSAPTGNYPLEDNSLLFRRLCLL